MKLLAIYSTDQILGGGEISFTLTLNLVQSAGWDVLAVLPAEGGLGYYLSQHGIPFQVLPQHSLRKPDTFFRLLVAAPSWVRLVNSFRPDLIHCNAIRPALYAQAVGRKLRLPVVLHARIEKRDPVDPLLAPRLSGIICSSGVVKQRFNGGSCPVVEVVHNPVDLRPYRSFGTAISVRGSLQRTKYDALVALPGRLSPSKGHLSLIKAAPAVVEQYPEVRFLFVGQEDPSAPHYRAELEMEIRSRSLAAHFTFTGFQEHMADIYRAADLVVFPTTSEGFGRIALEAGAARRALIANDLPVLHEILPGGGADYLIDCSDPVLFSARIVRLLKDREYRMSIADKLFEHVQRNFGLEAHREAILAVYQKILNRRRG